MLRQVEVSIIVDVGPNIGPQADAEVTDGIGELLRNAEREGHIVDWQFTNYKSKPVSTPRRDLDPETYGEGDAYVREEGVAGVRMIEGRLYRLTRPLGGGGWPDLPAGTVFTYRGTVDHLDWFQCLVEPVGGPVQRIGYGLPDYCEEVETD